MNVYPKRGRMFVSTLYSDVLGVATKERGLERPAHLRRLRWGAHNSLQQRWKVPLNLRYVSGRTLR